MVAIFAELEVEGNDNEVNERLYIRPAIVHESVQNLGELFALQTQRTNGLKTIKQVVN